MSERTTEVIITEGDHTIRVQCSPRTKRLIQTDAFSRRKVFIGALDNNLENALQEIRDIASDMEQMGIEMDDDDDHEIVPAPEVLIEEPASQNKKRKRAKVEVEFDDKSTGDLISAVEEHPCLWNAASENYKNRVLRDATWREISENVFDGKFDATQLSAKWTNLRIQFRSYKMKSKGKSGQAAKSKIVWKFYNSMLFVASAEESQTPTTESNLILDSDRDSGTPKTPVSSKVGNKLNRETCTPEDPTKAIALEGMRTAIQKMTEVDSFQVFGSYVAEELRKIPDVNEANRLQRKLARVLIDSLDDMEAGTSSQYPV